MNGLLTGDSARRPIAKGMLRPVQHPSRVSRGLVGTLMLALSALLARGLPL
jgi:hypothetical protein